ncbi:MAG: GAF domain-containing protein [candidate division Zixibacteria bacterium]|nr:GAF domain-containing protein [candidate division Zixibacteria bacterium]
MNKHSRRRNKVTPEDKLESASSPEKADVIAAGANESAKKQAPVSASPEERLTELTASNRQLKRKIFDLYTVFEISRNFNSVLNYQNLLDSFILTSLAQVSASKAAIFLPEDSRSDHYVMAKGKGSGPFPDPDQFIDGKGELAVFLTRLNRPVAVDELINDTANKMEQKLLAAFHSGLAVPMIFQARLTGFLLISEKFAANEFSSDDTEFLSILANQISVAIENARLYEAEKEATQQLRAAQQQLVNTERLAALGEMSARVAHEINNPLGIIINYMLLLRRAMKGNVEAGNYAEIVSEEIDRIARIVRQLLDFYRPVKDDFSPVDAISILEEVLELMSRQLDKLGIELVMVLPAEHPLFAGSPENIRQVFLNIIINACDAMPNGGKLEIELVASGSELTIDFCDTGTGISAKAIPRIFEPFFTTKQPGKGTGLGLSVCYGIIKRHDGSITYKNTKVGGCFEIKLPISEHEPSDEQDG